MNFYKRFMGDYAKDTAHLSLVEHGAYTLMLDTLYSTEKGLPGPYVDLFRICRAMSKAEQLAVAKVADEFFPVGADGLRWNGRASVELAEAAVFIDAARANGKKGGRPRKETDPEPNGFSDGTHPVSQTEPNGKAPQSHSQNSPSLRSGERATRLPKDWELPDAWRAWGAAERPDLNMTQTAATFADHWHSAAGQGARKLDWEGTWRNWVRKEFAPKKGFVPEAREWFDTRSGVEAKAAEHGIKPWVETEEQWPVYRQRVMKAAKGSSEGFLSLDQILSRAPERKAA